MSFVTDLINSFLPWRLKNILDVDGANNRNRRVLISKSFSFLSKMFFIITALKVLIIGDHLPRLEDIYKSVIDDYPKDLKITYSKDKIGINFHYPYEFELPGAIIDFIDVSSYWLFNIDDIWYEYDVDPTVTNT